MSHRNSKKSNRIGQSIQKHRALHPNPFEEEDRVSMEAKMYKELTNWVPELRDAAPPASPQRATDIPVEAALAGR